MTVGSSAAPQVIENVSFRDPKVVAIIVAEAGADTYIRLLSSDNVGDKDGKIHWHCKWAPLDEDGRVQPA